MASCDHYFTWCNCPLPTLEEAIAACVAAGLLEADTNIGEGLDEMQRAMIAGDLMWLAEHPIEAEAVRESRRSGRLILCCAEAER